MTSNRLAHAAPDHPPVKPAKIGVLLANLGTPDATDYWSMRRYLNEFLSDKRVVDLPRWLWLPLLRVVILTKRPFASGKAYASIWNNEANESPLLTITKQQTTAIKAACEDHFGDNVMVDFCMRYGNPSVKSKVAEMTAAGCEKILFFPLYPQYAGPTTATANDAFFRSLAEEKYQPAVRTAPQYFDNPTYINALAASITRAYADIETPDKLVVSYHGVPTRYLMEGDPYHCFCQKTTRLLKEKLGWDDTQILTTFQSKFGRAEWLTPATVDEVARLVKEGGVKKIAVVAPAFSADCIETLEEINEEIKESFEDAGGEQFTYIPCLNDEPAHIDALMDVIKTNLAGWA